MTQNLILSHATGIESLPNFFTVYWPQFADNTKQSLYNELYPYLTRCAELLSTLEPQLFSTTDPNWFSQTPSPSPPAHPSPTTWPTESQLQTVSRELARTPTLTRLASSRAQATSRRLSRAPASQKASRARSISHWLTPAQQPSTALISEELPPKHLPYSPAEIEKNLSDFFQSAREGDSKEPYLAFRRLQTTVWLHVIELRFRFLAIFKLYQTLVDHGDKNLARCTGPTAKQAIIQETICLHPDLERASIEKNINQYIERGKNYQKLVNDLSLSAVISLGVDTLSLYEYRQTNDVYNSLIHTLKFEGAKTTTELDLMPNDNIEKKLETLLQGHLERTIREYHAWYYGSTRPMGPNADYSLFLLADIALSTNNPPNADNLTGYTDSDNMQTLNPFSHQQTIDIGIVPNPVIDFGVPRIKTFSDANIPGTPEMVIDYTTETFSDTNIPGTPEIIFGNMFDYTTETYSDTNIPGTPEMVFGNTFHLTTETFSDTNIPGTPEMVFGNTFHHTTETFSDTNIPGTPELILRDTLYPAIETFSNTNIPRDTLFPMTETYRQVFTEYDRDIVISN